MKKLDWNQIMITMNYAFAFLYVFLGSLGLIAFVGMMTAMSIDLMVHALMLNFKYWGIIVGLTVIIGTFSNYQEGRFNRV